MAPLAADITSFDSSKSHLWCDDNAGILLLDTPEHSNIESSSPSQKKALAVMNMMSSPFHNSAPVLDFDLDLLERIIQSSKTPKTVRFAEYDEVQPTSHRSDMSPEDFAAMYLSAEEQTAAQQNALQASAAIVYAGGSTTDKVEVMCLRGLENHCCSERSQRFRATVNKLYDIVYDCQTFEDENGVQVPPEYLAQHLIQVSSYCADEARERALLDEEETVLILAIV
ncbi:hypothetical protein IV203_010971 [Nitzschia inconspicua]|uniref:Uncharacterized protein n=1 Tax=Nitzschia inconspicua TaxID=303405 RepID=A0A9K3PLY2_9STRA|nr:hypothetical protein IV203_010971 [Nitzschia inconspicua]